MIDWAWVKEEIIRRERISGRRDIVECLDECLKEAKVLAHPGTSSAIIPAITDFSIKKLSKHIDGATSLCVFVVTIGSGIEKKASLFMKKDVLKGYLMDRIGSFAVESLAQDFEERLRKAYAKKGCGVSMRISPGYCDWPIEDQFKLSKIAKFSRAGVRLTKNCMMVPVKSISAMVGIGSKERFSKKTSPCEFCDKDVCDYRMSNI